MWRSFRIRCAAVQLCAPPAIGNRGAMPDAWRRLGPRGSLLGEPLPSALGRSHARRMAKQASARWHPSRIPPARTPRRRSTTQPRPSTAFVAVAPLADPYSAKVPPRPPDAARHPLSLFSHPPPRGSLPEHHPPVAHRRSRGRPLMQSRTRSRRIPPPASGGLGRCLGHPPARAALTRSCGLRRSPSIAAHHGNAASPAGSHRFAASRA